jgi:hypothetical protein
MTAADLEEAAQYLKWTLALAEAPPPEEWAGEPGDRTVPPAERRAFAARQLSARRRLYLLRSFYGTCRSRMARVHLMTSAAVVLGRFCGFSATFDAIGDALMPVTDAGAPRTPAWSHYRAACDARKPRVLRDQLWVAAHVEDMERVRADGLDRAFFDEASLHAGNPTYRLLRQHVQLTLDTRLVDHTPLAGAVPYEETDLTPRKRIAKGGRLLLAAYGAETRRALLHPMVPSRPGVSGDREAAFALLASSVAAWGTPRILRRGVRLARRGMPAAEGDAWPLLATVLGTRASGVSPLVLELHSNPGRFQLTATPELDTRAARFWSWVLTKLLGQRLHAAELPQMEGRCRLFQRDDGSMHLLRELRAGDAARVFEADLVLREDAGQTRLAAVFPDEGVEVDLDVEPSGKTGLLVRSRRVLVRGRSFPHLPITVEMRTRRAVDASGRAGLEVEERLLLQPATALGRLIVHGILRRPEELRRVRYRASPEAS